MQTPTKPIHSAFQRTARDITPLRLRLLLMLILAVSLAFCILSIHTIQQHDKALQTIGVEAGPSVVAAQEIKIGILTMDSDLADELLYKSGQSEAAERLEDFNKSRIETSKSLVTAARNITYGNAELFPIENLQSAFGQFLMQAQTARDVHEKGQPEETLKAYRDALATLRTSVLTNADALNKSNQDMLIEVYNQEKSASALARGVVLLTGLILLCLLAYTQIYLKMRFKRIFNPPLLVGSILLLLFVQHLYQSLADCSNFTRVAKEDSYDSIVALLGARAASYDANASESRWLLDKEKSATYTKEFQDDMNRVAKFAPGNDLDKTIALAQKQLANGDKFALPQFSGEMAEEFNNIRFNGEGQAAIDALRELKDYLATDAKMRALDTNGQHDGALKLGLSRDTRGSDYWFQRFDDALGRALTINQEQLESAFKDGKKCLDNQILFALVISILVVACAYYGILPRIQEYSRN
jgi:hypothetical protein